MSGVKAKVRTFRSRKQCYNKKKSLLSNYVCNVISISAPKSPIQKGRVSLLLVKKKIDIVHMINASLPYRHLACSTTLLYTYRHARPVVITRHPLPRAHKYPFLTAPSPINSKSTAEEDGAEEVQVQEPPEVGQRAAEESRTDTNDPRHHGVSHLHLWSH